ncbi:hypothetical protein KKB18_03580 [bacterium]|nr:hypothetical protein [bacterium]
MNQNNLDTFESENRDKSVTFDGSSRYLLKITGFILVILLLFNFLSYLQYSRKVLECPYPAEYGEGVVYNLCYRMSINESLYKPIDQMPYIHTPYTPLYFFLASTLMKMTKTSPVTCRLVSIFSTFGIIVVIFFMIFKKTGSIFASSIFSLFLFSSPYFFEWSPLMRVDITGIFFTLVGLYIATTLKRSDYTIFLSIPFFLAGIMTKQIFFAAPISVIIYLIIVNRKKAVKFSALFFGCLAIIYYILQWITDGNFYFHVVKSNILTYDLSCSIIALGITITAYYGITSLSALSFASAIKEKEITPIHIYLIISFLTSFSIGKAGGANNHLLEFVIACTINAGFAIDFFLKKVPKTNKAKNSPLLIPTVLMLSQVISLYFIDTSVTNKMSQKALGSKKKPVAWTPYNQSKVPEYDRLDVEQYRQISKYINSVEGPILCENLGLLTVNGKTPLYQPFQFKHLAEMGCFDESKILDMVEKGEFKLVIMTKSSVADGKSWLYSDKLLDAIWRNYAPIKTIGEYEIYAYVKSLM